VKGGRILIFTTHINIALGLRTFLIKILPQFRALMTWTWKTLQYNFKFKIQTFQVIEHFQYQQVLLLSKHFLVRVQPTKHSHNDLSEAISEMRTIISNSVFL
jgi:hypothetical protein